MRWHQKVRRYLNWWDPRFFERFSDLTHILASTCTYIPAHWPLRAVYQSVRMRAPYVKCCVGSVTAGRAQALLALPSLYLRVLWCHARTWQERTVRTYMRVFSTRLCRIWVTCRDDERSWTWRGTCVGHEKCTLKCGSTCAPRSERPKCTTSSGKSELPLCSALLQHFLPERRINSVLLWNNGIWGNHLGRM